MDYIILKRYAVNGMINLNCVHIFVIHAENKTEASYKAHKKGKRLFGSWNTYRVDEI